MVVEDWVWLTKMRVIPLPAWADESLAELAVQLGNMVGHLNQV